MDESSRRADSRVRSLVDTFLSPGGAGRRYLLGRNEHSEVLTRIIDIDGIIDDFADPGTVWQDVRVIHGSEVPRDAIVVNCSLSIRPVSAHKRIEELGVAGVLAYADLSKVYPDRVPFPDFVLKTRLDVEKYRRNWDALSASLADEFSRKLLSDLLTFRLTGDYSSMTEYSVRLADQYFEDFFQILPGEVLVDGGGFDGDTTEIYCERFPGYKRIYFFEPSALNLAKARERLKKFPHIEYIRQGLSDRSEKLCFDQNAGSASTFSASGDTWIDVTTLDQYVAEKIDFIKLDVEGWEVRALAGGRSHIAHDHPKLAISVYHDPSDFWRTFEFITDLRNDYDVYLRHYTEGWSETIMYFNPRK